MFELLIAAVAGLVAFLSPCVLPLVPAYISYMSGRVSNTVAAQVAVNADGSAEAVRPGWTIRFSTALHAVAFVGGFTTVFVAFGVVAAALEAVLGGILIRLGGVLIILFGLHFMGAVPILFNWLRREGRIISNPLTTITVGLFISATIIWGFTGTITVWHAPDVPTWTMIVAMIPVLLLWVGFVSADAITNPGTFWNNTMDSIDMLFYADTRRDMAAEGSSGLLGSYMMGLVFSAGWTPCIGPTLGAAMGLAASQDTVLTGMMQMAAFSLGLGIPFILTALMLDSAQGQLRKLNRHMSKIKLFTGVLLIFVGVLMVSGELTNLSARLNTTFADFSYRLEECTVGIVEGEIGLDQAGSCYNGDVPYELLVYRHTGEQVSRAQRRAILADVVPTVDTSTFDLGETFPVRVHDCNLAMFYGQIPAEWAELCYAGSVDLDTLAAHNGEDITRAELIALAAPQDAAPQGSATSPDDQPDPGPSEAPLDGVPITELPGDSGLALGNAESISALGEAAADREDTDPLYGNPIIQPDNTAPEVGIIAREIVSETPQGERLALSDFRGQTVLLNFWYTTCPPCLEEMPDFQIISEEYADDDFVILAVNRRESAALVSDFADELGLTFPLLLDEDGDINFDYFVSGYPTSYLIGADGVILDSRLGALSIPDIEAWAAQGAAYKESLAETAG